MNGLNDLSCEKWVGMNENNRIRYLENINNISFLGTFCLELNIISIVILLKLLMFGINFQLKLKIWTCPTVKLILVLRTVYNNRLENVFNCDDICSWFAKCRCVSCRL